MEENTIDLRELIEIIFSNIRTIIKFMAGFVLVALIYVLVATPVYESQALLRVKQPQGLGSSLFEAATGGNSSMTQQRMSTYAEILKSRSVVVPVIRKIEKKNKNGKYPAYRGYVAGHISTVPLKNTEILQVKMTASDPEKAKIGNELLLKSFLERMTTLNRAEQTASKEFLMARTEEAKGDLGVAETALQDYRIEHDFISPEEDIRVFADRIADVKKQAISNEVELEAAKARLAAVNGQLEGAGRNIADNAVISSLNAQLAKLEAEKISYIDKYTAEHPRMKSIEAEIKGLRKQIALETEKVADMEAPGTNTVHQGLVAAKFESEGVIAVCREKAQALEKLVNENNKELAKLPELEKGYVSVARDAKVASEIYIMLAKRLEEAKVAEVMVVNDVQLIDTPTLPEFPIKPRKTLTVVLAAILGMLAGGIFAVTRALMNRKVTTEEDLKSMTGIPVIGIIPEEKTLLEAMEKEKKEKTLMDKIRGLLWKI